ncbi:KH [Musa troglodytarum]|uniref:KH n=1 Tax=Musa troglodytarum TaxID=320322 RepID=A0A9E7E922_9LILI|nr:KH [Musa troglodytarum]
MDERFPPAVYFQYSPSGVHSSPSPHHSMRSPATSDRKRSASSLPPFLVMYLAGLLAERQKLGPFLQVLPFSCRLLNQDDTDISLNPALSEALDTYGLLGFQLCSWMVFWFTITIFYINVVAEIVQASGLAPNQTFVHHERIEHVTPLRLIGYPSIGGPMDLEGRSGMHTEENEYFHRTGILQASAPGWNGTAGGNTSPIIKKVIRLDIPEEKPRNKPGYEHVNEPLHVPVEAEFTADIVDLRLNQAVTILEVLLKPMVESMDYYKKQQLRELATPNGALREESPHMSPSASPFNSTGMKQAKTGR